MKNKAGNSEKTRSHGRRSHLCILPAPPPGWRVCPCWGPSAPSRSLWRFPWACGPAGRWGSPRSRSCHTTVPAAGCWTRTGCSTTGSAGRSSQSSRCSRRSPGRRAYLGVKRKKEFLKEYYCIAISIKIPPQKKNSLAAANVPCQSSTLFRGASSDSIAHLISLLQPPFGFDFKWKMITQIAIAIFDLGKDKRSLSMASHYRVTDNAAPPTPPLHWPMPKSSNCCNWSHMWLSVGPRNTFPRFGEAQRSQACVMHGGLDLIPHGQHALSAGGGSSRSVHGTCYSFVQLVDCEKKIQALWL